MLTFNQELRELNVSNVWTMSNADFARLLRRRRKSRINESFGSKRKDAFMSDVKDMADMKEGDRRSFWATGDALAEYEKLLKLGVKFSSKKTRNNKLHLIK